MNKTQSLQEIQQEFIDKNLIPLFDNYKYRERLLAKTQEGYFILTRLDSFKKGCKPNIFHLNNPYTIQNIKLWLKLNNKLFELVSEEYINSKTNLKWKCLKDSCGEIFEMSWSHILGGSGCSCCASRQIGLSNCLATKRPDLIKYLKNIEDGFKYTLHSYNIITIKCCDCGYEKNTRIDHFTNNIFNCPKCSDKVPYPEKFMFNILEQLGLNFKTQLTKTTFKWCKNYRYDFYISDLNYIIETHGMQHYKDTSDLFLKTLKEEQYNDNTKRDLALSNGISNYFIIDCRYSELEWIKNNIMQSELPILLNFKEEDIDWLKCHEYACNSLVKIACDMWNSGIEIKGISTNLQISKYTIRNYLKKGTQLNWCYYNGKEERIKFLEQEFSKENHYNSKKIICITTNEIFQYVAEADKKYNVGRTNISANCNGRQKSAGKHPVTGEKLVWMHYEDYLNK